MQVRRIVALLAAVVVGSTGAVTAHATSDGHHGHRYRWVHHADLDNDGKPDRIVITTGPHFQARDDDITGRYVVRVHLSSTDRVVSRTLVANGYVDYSHREGRHRSPWFGATHLDRVGGKEILLGQTSGASSTIFYALAYFDGRLVDLPSPISDEWFVTSSLPYSNDWICHRSTIVGFDRHPLDRTGRRAAVHRAIYAWQDDHWVVAKSSRRVVPNRELLAAHARRKHEFIGFDCPGLPPQF